MNVRQDVDVAVVGAGLAGIATAHYLCKSDPDRAVLLIDGRTPMSYTSAQSGDNYRNWWPHATMTAFTNHSIDLLEEVARESANRINLTRRGYLLATRQTDIDDVTAQLDTGYADSPNDSIRTHARGSAETYTQNAGEWESAPRGVDILSDPSVIRREFPGLSDEVQHLVHVRRAGDISGQQLGQYMLEALQASSCSRLAGTVTTIEAGSSFKIDVQRADETIQVRAERLVIAAGPFSGQLAAQIGCELPVKNYYHQKIAFEDRHAAIPRTQPFACDLDDVVFDWSDAEREFLREDASTAWLASPIAGGVHCRPDGGDHSAWLKIGWAYNQHASEPQEFLENEPRKNDQFPEIALRAAARLNPALSRYVEEIPTSFMHYGGYYTMTPENWPLIGPTSVPEAYVVGALSGFGTMAACAAGSLCAAWMNGDSLPDYATSLSLRRYDDDDLMGQLRNSASRGIL